MCLRQSIWLLVIVIMRAADFCVYAFAAATTRSHSGLGVRPASDLASGRLLPSDLNERDDLDMRVSARHGNKAYVRVRNH